MNLVERALDVRPTRASRGAVLGAHGSVSDRDAFEGATTQISKKYRHLSRTTSLPKSRGSTQSGISVHSCRLGDVRTLVASGQRVTGMCGQSVRTREGPESNDLLASMRVGSVSLTLIACGTAPRLGIVALAARDEDATPVARRRAKRRRSTIREISNPFIRGEKRQ